MFRFSILPRRNGRALARTALLAGLGWLALGAPAAAQTESFEPYAQRARERYALDGLPRGPESFELFLHTRCHKLELGAFDVLFPADSALDKRDVKLLSSVVRDLIELQGTWGAWTLAGTPDDLEGDLEDQLATAAKWFKKWSASRFKRADAGASVDLAEKLGAPGEVREALQRAREALLRRAGQPGGEPLAPARIVLAPRRATYIDLVALAGWCDEGERDGLWQQATWTGTNVWLGSTQIVALEYVLSPFDARRPDAGQPMTATSKTGLSQHVSDRGAAALLNTVFYRYADPMVEATLATNLVIGAVGENDLSPDIVSFRWTREGGKTKPFTRFIPAGGTFGEALTPRKAQAGPTKWSFDYKPAWRTSSGRDYFTGPLRSGQKSGAKKSARDPERSGKVAHFPLQSPGVSGDHIVSAPFLGSFAEGREAPPAEFLDDYEEFFRAYQASFFEWLRTEAVDGDEDASRARFGTLLRRLADQTRSEDLEEATLAVYERPLSAHTEDEQSLEWRYLRWLARGR